MAATTRPNTRTTWIPSLPRTIRYYEGVGLTPQPERTAAAPAIGSMAANTSSAFAFINSAQRGELNLGETKETLSATTASRNAGTSPG